ncbi:MAG: xanthine phosphoribosyltransferase [Erysipelotrichaceae bacterium]|jgi:xanthine phosphoribosyltransferase|nr:xanthine phosphoribosyltransferase [Erysipelotrichaceae bacterium]
MELLKKRIIEDGRVLPGQILKVDAFLNHQIDVALLDEMGKEFQRLFPNKNITRILTLEASGIAVACSCGRAFGVPVVFAKKNRTKNLSGDLYRAQVLSYTTKKPYEIVVSQSFLNERDRILIIDDFLAKGSAVFGMIDLVQQAKAELVGVGIAIEKGFQEGGKRLRKSGVVVESLAIIASMSDEEIVFG